MTKTKRLLLMTGLAALLAKVAFCYDVGDFSYSYSLSTKEATVTAYNGSSSHVTIPTSFSAPETYKDKDDGETHTRYHTITVTGIGNSVFANKTFITSVVLHNKIKKVGSSVFSGCTGLVEAEIDGTGLSLSRATSLFENCASLRRLVFGDGVTSLPEDSSGSTSLRGCIALEEVSVGSGVTAIPSWFLYASSADKRPKPGKVSFAGAIASVGYEALSCSSLTKLEIRLAEGCTVSSYAFSGCPGVNERNVDFSKIASIDSYAFSNCRSISGTVDLARATRIGNDAFYGCSGISAVKTSGALTSMGYQAFQECTGLVEAEIDGTGLSLSRSTSMFVNCSSLRRLVFGDGVTSLPDDSSGSTSLKGCIALEEVSVGSGVTKIPSWFLYASSADKQPRPDKVSFAGEIASVGSYALSCSSLTNLEIRLAEGCTVSSYAFSDCPGVNEWNVDFSKIASVDASAFWNCRNISGTVDLERATRIGNYAFYGCSGISAVKTSASLTSMGCRAFLGCTGLVEAEINGFGLSLFKAVSLFENCSSLRRLVFGDGVTSLPEGSSNAAPLMGCIALEEIFVGSGVTDIPAWFIYADTADMRPKPGKVSFAGEIASVGSYALYCSSLTNLEIRLAEGCTVSWAAFSGCPGVNERNVDFSKIATVGDYAFSNCRNISGPVDLARATRIGTDAFHGCSGISAVKTSVVLTSMGYRAFQECTGLVEAEVNGTGLSLSGASSLFEKCSSLRRVSFGDGVTSLTAFLMGCTALEEVSVGSGVRVIPSKFIYVSTADMRPKLGKVSFAGAIASIGSYALSCSSLTDLEIRLAEGCTVSSYAFSGCPGANERNVDFSKIASIDSYAFYGCTGIAAVFFGAGLTSIGSSAFYGCTNAGAFAFAGAPPSVGSSAFKNVKSGAVGTYTAGYAAAWEAVIDEKGYWNGLKMKPSHYTVIYDANNGTGTRTTATAEWGDPTPAGDGTFTWGDHYFLGWALAPDGEVVYRAGDRIAEPVDGHTVTLYAVWTKTLTLIFYNNEQDKTLSPASLADHLTWSVDGESQELKSGESIEITPGERKVTLHVDDSMTWAVGRFDLGIDNPYFDAVRKELTLHIGNGASPFLPVTPESGSVTVFVKVNPVSQDDAFVRFACTYGIRASLQFRIKAGELPFERANVHITIGRAGFNESGILVPLSGNLLENLKPDETYCLPRGFYYVESVTYDADRNGGDPYWGAVLEGNLANRMFEVGEDYEININFDVFGGVDAILVTLDSSGGACSKSRMWFTAHGDGGSITIDKELPTPEKAGCTFKGWFTAKTNGRKVAHGDAVIFNVLYAHWEAISHKVTFNANGGSGTMAVLTVGSGRCGKLPKCTLTHPKGKKFVGWACSNGKFYDDEMLVFDLGNVMMTAIWE